MEPNLLSQLLASLADLSLWLATAACACGLTVGLYLSERKKN